MTKLNPDCIHVLKTLPLKIFAPAQSCRSYPWTGPAAAVSRRQSGADEQPAVVAAAQTFLNTLSPAQSNGIIYATNLANAGRWSNFPDYEATRNELQFTNFTSIQREAADEPDPVRP